MSGVLSSAPDGPAATNAALVEWITLAESLVRGLVHTLNNRLTALSAFAELAAQGEDEFSAQRTLPAELDRLRRVGALFGLLAMEPGQPEALELCAILDDACALHAHDSRVRAVHCKIVRDVPHAAVRAPRCAVLRLMLVLLESGKQHAEQRGRDVVALHVGCTEPWVTVHLDGAALSPALRTLAGMCDAVAVQAGDTVVIRLTTLQELRRRERAARAVPAE